MCRIAGIVNPAFKNEELMATITAMCQLQKHGGPDDEGFYLSTKHQLVFGHRRLSIIDLSEGGHQPMSYADGRYCITYNGELYNYLEIKNELIEKGCRFNTISDTEVILAAFATWGTGAFKRFNGMYAFALWDDQDEALYLVRDAMGIKPLYVAHTKEGLAFASEVRALKHISYLQKKDDNWPVYLMAYGHLPEPVTTLLHVKPLEKGSYLKYSPTSNTAETEVFAHFSYLEKIGSRTEAVQKIKEVLRRSVKRHLISDAAIGVFLSGGLDSSIIALLADNDQERLNTISIYFDEHKYSENKYQDIIQQQLSCNHHQHLLKEGEFHTYFPGILDTMDLPSCDGINIWFISKYAKESGLKAVLSGIGGDELFGGYPSFKRMKAALFLSKMPNKLLRSGRFTNSKQLRRLAYLSIKGPVGKYLFLRGQFIPSAIAKQLDANEAEIWRILEHNPLLQDIDNLTAGNQASWIETNLYMQNQLLRDADVMSMAHGVEIRVPFLDIEFVNLLLQVKSDIKYAGDFNKQLLIDSFADILPEAIWKRPKMGFSFPFKEWLANDEYAQSSSLNHKKLIAGTMHWSQFLTLLLIEAHADA